MATKNRHLNISEICGLIKACSEAEVKEITFGDLHISFASKAIEAPTEQAIAGTETPKNIEQEIEYQELAVKEDQLAHMLAEDPAGYERLRIAGELDG